MSLFFKEDYEVGTSIIYDVVDPENVHIVTGNGDHQLLLVSRKLQYYLNVQSYV